MRTVALYGGSFNPPHVGHTLLALWVLETAPVDELWMIPALRHPFDKPLVDFDHRFAMCQLALAPLAARARVLRSEEEIGGESRTLFTVRYLREQHPDATFRLVFGTDILRERERWFGWDELERIAPPIYVARQGHEAIETRGLPAMPAVSSSEVRRRLREGRDVSALVPRAVLGYIRTNGLYGASAGGPLP